jgi:putative transposase
MNAWLKSLGRAVNRKRVQRLMRLMGHQGVGPKPDTSQRSKQYKVYSYLFRGYVISRPLIRFRYCLLTQRKISEQTAFKVW